MTTPTPAPTTMAHAQYVERTLAKLTKSVKCTSDKKSRTGTGSTVCACSIFPIKSGNSDIIPYTVRITNVYYSSVTGSLFVQGNRSIRSWVYGHKWALADVGDNYGLRYTFAYMIHVAVNIMNNFTVSFMEMLTHMQRVYTSPFPLP